MGKKEKTEVELKLGPGKEFKRIPHKYDHIGVGFSLTPFSACPRSTTVTVTSTKKHLQYKKKLEQASINLNVGPDYQET